MNEEMLKSLNKLIDETMVEIESLKKSERFSASEIKLDGPGSGIAGRDSNGSMGKKDNEDEEDEDKDEEDKKKKEGMDKGEGQNRQADPNGGHHQMDKGEMYAGAADGSSHGSSPGQNRQADPNGGHHMSKAEKEEEEKKKKKDEEDKKKKDSEDKDDDKKMAFMKKSAEESNTLLKSYVDIRLAPIETSLKEMMGLLKQVADTPAAPARGTSYRNITPLVKSDEGSTLTKSAVVEKLFELKKSGTRVDSVDIASAELANGSDLAKIVQKYNIK